MFKKAFASFLVFTFVCTALSTFLVWFLFNSVRSFDYQDEGFVNAVTDFVGYAFVDAMADYPNIPLTEADYQEVVRENLDADLVGDLIEDYQRQTFREPINDNLLNVSLPVSELLYEENGLMTGVARMLYDKLAICFDEGVEFGLYTCRAQDLQFEDFKAAVFNDINQSGLFVDSTIDIHFPLKVSGSLGLFLTSIFNSFLLFSGVCLAVMLLGIVLLTLESGFVAARFVSLALLISVALMMIFTLGLRNLPDVFNVVSGAEDFALNFEQSQLVFSFLALSIGQMAVKISPYLAGALFFLVLDFIVLIILRRRYDSQSVS